MQEKIQQYALMLGDSPLILGHRLSELCGHGPSLETDMALTNISLDLLGQVRHYFQYVAKLKGDGTTEDDLAFLRYEPDYHNLLLTEQPNTDFAFIIGRQFLFDAYHLPLLEQLMESRDEQLAAIATKSIKEVRYHLRFSSEWVKRLGAGTEESHRRMQKAINALWHFTPELFEETELERAMKEAGFGADLEKVKVQYDQTIQEVMQAANLQLPAETHPQFGGKKGIHSEQLGFILADLQYMQRAYPNMTW